MKIVPILAVTNALALALAIFLYVQQGELKAQTGSRRSDSGEVARLAARLESLEREHQRVLEMRGIEPAPAAEAPAAAADPEKGAAAGETPALGARPAEEGEEPPAAGGEEFDPKEMNVFRKKVRKALELNNEEDQKVRIFERIDELVKQNKIAPLSAKQKESVAATVLVYRRKIPEVWRKVAEGGGMENVSREERGRIVRAEYEALRTEAQRSLEEFMPAVDAKTYLDETMRDQMRGGFGGFPGGPPVQAPAPPSTSR
ncbi:MAG: hypothetical protein L6Q95_06900 [Planctomycetes bacterium]|nr:hypothetical protein [Planctomycetota bacterium]